MEWLVAIGAMWLGTFVWLAGFAVAFGVLVRLTPCNRGMYWWKNLRGLGADFAYWFVVPLFLRFARTLMLVVAVGLLCGGREPGILPLEGVPLWAQCVAILLIQDVILYWVHRLFHTRAGWDFHAVHHAPKVLDWTASARFHPVNYLLEFALADVVVLLLGFAPEALVTLVPFNVVYSAMVHANLNWTFGPLRFVFASPVFHRWHHTLEEEGLDKNFASTFPFLDLLFGTFYMPPGRVPERFGTGEPDFPEGFWGQFAHPFRRPGEPLPDGGRRRPVAVKPILACTLAAVGLVGGAGYYIGRQEEVNDPGMEMAEPPPFVAEPPAVPLRLSPAVLSVAISADGTRVVSGSEDGTVKVRDVATGQDELVLRGHRRAVRGVAISADGACVVSGSSDASVKVWDGYTGQERFTLAGHASPVMGVAVSADGRVVVSVSADGTAKVWDAETGREKLTRPRDPEAGPGVAVSADGRVVVSASGWAAKVWDARAGNVSLPLSGHKELVYGVAISPDGGRAVSGGFDDRVIVWDARTGREVQSLRGHGGPVYSVAISADGERVVSGSRDGTVKVWAADTGREEQTLRGHAEAVTSVAISADGMRVVSGSRDGTVKVWAVREGGFREESEQPAPPVGRR